jgi:hypothetical protein
MTAEQELREIIARAIYGEPAEFDWRGTTWDSLPQVFKDHCLVVADRVISAYDAFWTALTADDA